MDMQMDPEFFLDEVRDGFLVPSMMKRAWAAGLKDYMTLIEVGRRVGARPFAMFGTVMGAARYGGYIPWDDDIDTEMLHDEYLKVKALYDRGELPGEYCISDYLNGKNQNLVRKWLDSPDVLRSEDGLEGGFGFPFTNNVDIFIDDYIPGDEQTHQYYTDVIQVLSELQYMTAEYEEAKKKGEPYADMAEYEYNLDLIERAIEVKFDRGGDVPVSTQIWQALEDFCCRFGAGVSDKIGCIPYYIDNRSRAYPKEFYADVIELPFEGAKIPVPIGYDAMLRSVYGNYGFPVLDFNAHLYPFYKFLEEVTDDSDALMGRYVFSPEKVSSDFAQCSGGVIPDRGGNMEVVFLVEKVANWPSLHTLWEAESNTEGTHVTVIPVPYCYKDYAGKPDTDHMIVETEGYPEEVVLTRWEDYDLAEIRPDVIYFQDPYDEFGGAIVADSFFYSSNLIKYTKELVFIPPFILREIAPTDGKSRYTLGEYVRNPGLVYADMVVVQSESMREVYIELLREMDPDGMIDWESKIVAGGSALTEWKERSRVLIRSEGEGQVYDKSGMAADIAVYDEIVDVPDGWIDLIKRPDGSFRKIVLYHINASVLFQYGKGIVDKTRKVFEFFGEYSDDIVVIWSIDPATRKAVRKNNPEGWRAFQKLSDDFKNNQWGIYDDIWEMKRAATLCDAYYGDVSPMMTWCREAGKPVLWETPGTSIDRTEPYDIRKWDPEVIIATEGEWSVSELLMGVLVQSDI